MVSANRVKLGPVAASRLRESRHTAFVSDQMTHGGQKGFGMTKHGRSGHATRSPRFRFLQKLEGQKNDRKDRSRIKDPKQSVEELLNSRKPTRNFDGGSKTANRSPVVVSRSHTLIRAAAGREYILRDVQLVRDRTGVGTFSRNVRSRESHKRKQSR